MRISIIVMTAFIAVHFACSGEGPGIVKEEFIYEEASFPSCHASTLVETQPGELLAAWFGGTDEGENDVGIWTSRWDGKTWSPPVEAASAQNVPCWNPVLFQMPDGETCLFYKAGPSPREWSGLIKRSRDGGQTWSEEELLPAGILGPIKNKPVLLKKGDLVCGSSVESWRTWTCWMEITPDGGKTWSKYGPIVHPDELNGIIQPTIYLDQDGNLRMLCRSTRRIGYICSAISKDGGKTWSTVRNTDLPHPGSGIDAVALEDGRIVLIYNHTRSGRSPLNVGLSKNGGDAWEMVVTLENEPGEYSYPAVIQTRDGMVHTTYTWKRQRIKHVVLDPSKW
ncbi:MAG: exo-alpha-sialidase [Candidatus Omnitrophica bacterium]|nr:exo-alpha-sialidase [Candidatus Omnitrophota bacterium]